MRLARFVRSIRAVAVALAFLLVGAVAARAEVAPARRPQAELRPPIAIDRPAGALRLSDPVPLPADVALPVLIEGAWWRVRAEAGLESAAARAAARLPVTFAAIAADLEGLPVPGTIEVRLVHRAEDLAKVAPPGRGAPPWAAGVAWPDLGVLAVAGGRGPEPIDLISTLDHELAHLALGAALGDRAPRWLHEGFAYLHSSDWSLPRAHTLTAMAWTGDVVPLAELDGHFRGAEDLAGRAYAQAYDFVAFLATRGRFSDAGDDGDRWPFRAFLIELAGGAALDDAARLAFAASIRDLHREWYDHLRQRYLMVPLELLAGIAWVLAAVLLILGFLRRRRMNRRVLARWEIEERGAPATVIAFPSVSVSDSDSGSVSESVWGSESVSVSDSVSVSRRPPTLPN